MTITGLTGVFVIAACYATFRVGREAGADDMQLEVGQANQKFSDLVPAQVDIIDVSPSAVPGVLSRPVVLPMHHQDMFWQILNRININTGQDAKGGDNIGKTVFDSTLVRIEAYVRDETKLQYGPVGLVSEESLIRTDEVIPKVSLH